MTYLTDARKHSDIMVTSGLKDLKALDTCTGLESRSAISCRSVIFIKLDVLQVVSPETECTRTRRFANVIVTGVLNGQSQVQITREVNTELNLGDVSDVN
jgi:hypothetical protein